MSRKVEITIHTKQRLIIHGAEAGRGWCPQCNREADVVALDKARLSAGVDEANIAERPRSGGWHTSMSLNGRFEFVWLRCWERLPVWRPFGV